jgi:glutaredoxin/glutathione-dependent peroxiredoxin
MIKIGDKLPHAEFFVMTAEGKTKTSSDVIFAGRKVALFAVPGAFTGTCTKTHLPGFINAVSALKAKGIDMVACTSVNDIDVMAAWGKQNGAEGKIMMLADGNATFAKALGLDVDKTADGMGIRSRRYSMVVDNGVVQRLNVEEKPGVNVSGADTILSQL